MNYLHMTIDELLHYGELDAETDLEKALVKALDRVVNEYESLSNGEEDDDD